MRADSIRIWRSSSTQEEKKVREIIKMIGEDGWYLVVMKGSHRQYKHPENPELITIAGYPGNNLSPGTLHCVYKQDRMER